MPRTMAMPLPETFSVALIGMHCLVTAEHFQQCNMGSQDPDIGEE